MIREFSPLLLIFGVLAALVVLFGLAFEPAHAHSWYAGLTDERGRSCCNDRDCAPIDVEEVKGGFRMRHPRTGEPVFVPYAQARPSQDERFHACFAPGEAGPRCFFAPGGV